MTYAALVAGYGVAAAGLLFAARDERFWPSHARAPLAPGLSLPRVLPILVAVVLIGQIMQRLVEAPSDAIPRLVFLTASQLVIFAPVFVIAGVALHRGDAESRRVVLLPRTFVAERLLVGVAAAAAALLAHQAVAGRIPLLGESVAGLLSLRHVQHLPQILGEDLAIALLLSSLLHHVRARTAIVATGLLFALGHVPAMLGSALRASDLAQLVADGLLSAAVVAVLLRLRDVWCVWPVHVVMDLTQFIER